MGDTVQDKLISLADKIKELANGVIPDGSVTPDKFSPDISSFLTSASIRCNCYTENGEYTFNVQRSGCYKITVVGAGAGGGLNPSDNWAGMGGGGGAATILWKDLKEGDVCTLKVGKKGNGLVINDDNELLSSATAGSSSEFYLNGTLILCAEGGVLGRNSRAQATGGVINYSGACPTVGKIQNPSSSPSLVYSIGGDSILGRGAAFEGDSAGIGAGGFAGAKLGVDYYTPGTDGSDGAVIIEYLS